MSVYVVSHKEIDFELPIGYKKIYVGKNSKQLAKNEDAWTDSTGQEIANKNSRYSELTAQYWIWKNTKDNIKGLVHYRRLLRNPKKFVPISFENIEGILQNDDVIVSQKVYVRNNIQKDYENHHYKKDLDAIKDVIVQIHPQYIPSYNKVMSSKNYHSLNILMTSSEIFDAYSEWLFSILFEVESRINMDNYSGYQARVYGFLSERLLDVWLTHNKKNIVELPILFRESNWQFLIKRQLRQAFNKLV